MDRVSYIRRVVLIMMVATLVFAGKADAETTTPVPADTQLRKVLQDMEQALSKIAPYLKEWDQALKDANDREDLEDHDRLRINLPLDPLETFDEDPSEYKSHPDIGSFRKSKFIGAGGFVWIKYNLPEGIGMLKAHLRKEDPERLTREQFSLHYPYWVGMPKVVRSVMDDKTSNKGLVFLRTGKKMTIREHLRFVIERNKTPARQEYIKTRQALSDETSKAAVAAWNAKDKAQRLKDSADYTSLLIEMERDPKKKAKHEQNRSRLLKAHHRMVSEAARLDAHAKQVKTTNNAKILEARQKLAKAEGGK